MNMHRPDQRAIHASPRFWGRTRVRLGLGLIVAGILPSAVLLYFRPFNADASVVQTTATGMLVAIALSYYFLKNMITFPGIRAHSFFLPSCLAGYGIALTAYFFLRLDYSRSIFLTSFILTLVWFYISHFLAARSGHSKIGVVPFGDIATLFELTQVRWVRLRMPSIGNGHYDALVADFRADLPDEWEAFLSDCALDGLAVFHVKQLRESLTGRVEIEHLSENSFGSLVPFMAYLKAKQVLDVVSAALVGLALLPFLLTVALMVRLDSPGPALFRQRRTGYRGRPFFVTKFRTMSHVQSKQCERQGAITADNDARITRLGQFLRRTRIDELPQIYNILRGEMSWIGPRPEAEVLSKWYETELPFYRYRHIVPPGISGWAQVNQGHVSDLENVKFKLHFDFYYIKNFSPWLDVLIVARTIRTMLTGYGAR